MPPITRQQTKAKQVPADKQSRPPPKKTKARKKKSPTSTTPPSQPKQELTPEEQYFRKIYHDPKCPAAFRGLEPVLQEMRKEFGDRVNRKQVAAMLSKDRSWSMFKQISVHNRKQCFPIAIYVKNESWCGDLLDVQDTADENDGVRYLFTIKDIFTRYCFVLPLKTKEAAATAEAFQNLLNSLGPENKPEAFCSDNGSEFIGEEFKNMLEKNNIYQYFSYSPLKQVALA